MSPVYSITHVAGWTVGSRSEPGERAPAVEPPSAKPGGRQSWTRSLAVLSFRLRCGLPIRCPTRHQSLALFEMG